MSITPQPLPEIQLPITPGEVIRLGWDGFGDIVSIAAGSIPWWGWVVFAACLVVSGKQLVPMIARAAFQYASRSSLRG